MSVLDSIRRFFRKKPREPEFDKVKFRKYDDYYGHFSVLYPKDWWYDPSVVVDEGGYAVVFHSNRSKSNFRIGVETVLPLKFDFRGYAKKEIEGPSSGIVSKACSSRFRKYRCYRTDYVYESGGEKFVGERIIFYTGDRVFSIFYTHPAEEKNLKKTIEYMIESIAIRPAKTKIFKRPLP